MKKNDEERIKKNMSIMGFFILLEAIVVVVATFFLWVYK